ncbi:hypothetical protein B0H16DRAFT_1322831 [Mycena metata]|uniref:Uncharacterized protein n=1 Tax=Mycena metata TaxID=1033252 RepID=A0AAD7IJT7_9AGAR|nr:hypothetical protein B0H16DRAFT_1322831 [Mycena metata]
MKKMAAQNFEDLLQCAIPVFEGLLADEHNKRVLDFLLGKLHMHPTLFIKCLSDTTTNFGRQLRCFVAHTCPHFDTQELPKEEAAQGRQKAQKKKTQPSRVEIRVQKKKSLADPKAKTMNLLTYKFHSLGDYVPFISWFGTSNSYSTQTVSTLSLGCDLTINFLAIIFRANLSIAM